MFLYYLSVIKFYHDLDKVLSRLDN